ncbi:MAG: acyl-CoA dehydrogenase family protein [Actinomycetes bacterium]
MDFDLSTEQVALVDGVQSFIEGRFPMATVRDLADEGGVRRDLWRQMADMGVFSLRLSEADGGAELGWADAVLAFEQLGRGLVPGPLVWTHLMAGIVDGAAGGDIIVSGIDRDDPSALVEFPGVVDVVVIADDRGLWSTDASKLEFAVLDPLDPLTPVGRVRGELPEGTQIADADQAKKLRLQGAALTSGLLLGISTASTELAVAYAKDRQQFGRPIGSFQSLKHLMADMFARGEVARGAVYAAGVTLDDPEVGSIERAVASAKLTSAEAALTNGKTCIQVHGGMGYTWEVDAHLYLKRAYALEPAFGTRDDWADAMAGILDTLV